MKTCNCKCEHTEGKKKIAVSVILDKSGSMESVRKSTISGFNEYLQSLKKDGNDYFLTLTLFDTGKKMPYVNAPIASVDELTVETYKPDGNTALYDAAVSTLKAVDIGGYDRALAVIITDGQENASREYKSADFRDLVKNLEKSGKYTFVYLGANQDAWEVAKDWGFAVNNVSTYNSTERGTSQAFASMAAATRSYSIGGQSATVNFLKDVKNEIENTK